MNKISCEKHPSMRRHIQNSHPFISLIHFLLLFVLVFNLFFFAFSHDRSDFFSIWISKEMKISNHFVWFFYCFIRYSEARSQWNVALINLKLKAFPRIFLNISQNLLERSLESLITFPRIFWNIPQNLLEHSPESSGTFPEIFWNIPRNLLEHSPESSGTFPRIFWIIPRNL